MTLEMLKHRLRTPYSLPENATEWDMVSYRTTLLSLLSSEQF